MIDVFSTSLMEWQVCGSCGLSCDEERGNACGDDNNITTSVVTLLLMMMIIIIMLLLMMMMMMMMTM